MPKIPVVVQGVALFGILGTSYFVYDILKPDWVAFEANASDTKFLKNCADKLGEPYRIENAKVYFRNTFLFDSEHTCY